MHSSAVAKAFHVALGPNWHCCCPTKAIGGALTPIAEIWNGRICELFLRQCRRRFRPPRHRQDSRLYCRPLSHWPAAFAFPAYFRSRPRPAFSRLPTPRLPPARKRSPPTGVRATAVRKISVMISGSEAVATAQRTLQNPVTC